MARKSIANIPCLYCNTRLSEEMEHFVPKCLFSRPRPQFMVTVPVCGKCNDDKKADDEYLRDWLAIDIENSGHPVAKKLLEGEVTRAARTNRSQLVRDIRTKSKIMPWKTMGGVLLGEFPAVQINFERMNIQFSRIVRGLYYKLHGRRLPDDTNFHILRVDVFRKEDAIQKMMELGVKNHRELGNNVFKVWHTWAEEDPTVTQWLMAFFNVMIEVTTNPQNIPDSEPAVVGNE